MKFVLYLAAVTAAVFCGTSAVYAASEHGPAGKVYVCKYVGTPGDGERLQTGQNPIDVSINAIKDYAGVGSYFNDAQGRSYVLAEDTGQGEPSVSQCPGYTEPTCEELDTCPPPPVETCEDRGDCPPPPEPTCEDTDTCEEPPVETCEDTDTCPLPPPPTCEETDTCESTTCEERGDCPPDPEPDPELTCEELDTCVVPPPAPTCEDEGTCPDPVPPTSTCVERGDCPATSTPPTPPAVKASQSRPTVARRAARAARAGNLPRTGAPVWLLALVGAASTAAGLGLHRSSGRRG